MSDFQLPNISSGDSLFRRRTSLFGGDAQLNSPSTQNPLTRVPAQIPNYNLDGSSSGTQQINRSATGASPTPPAQSPQPNPDEKLKKLGEHYLKQRGVEAFIKTNLIKTGYIFDTTKFNNLTLEKKLALYFWIKNKLNSKNNGATTQPTTILISNPTSGPTSRGSSVRGSQDFDILLPVIAKEIKEKKLTLEKLVARFFRAYLKNPQKVIALLRAGGISIRKNITVNDAKAVTIVKAILRKVANGTIAQKLEFLDLMRKIGMKDKGVKGKHFTELSNFEDVYSTGKNYAQLITKVLGLDPTKQKINYHIRFVEDAKTKSVKEEIYIIYNKKVGDTFVKVEMRVDDGIDRTELRDLVDNFGIKISDQGFAYLAHGASTDEKHLEGTLYETKQDRVIGLKDLEAVAQLFARLGHAYGKEKFESIRAEYLQAKGFQLIAVGAIFSRLDLAKGDGNRQGLIDSLKEQYRVAARELLDRIAPNAVFLDMKQLRTFHTAMAFALITKDPGKYFTTKDATKNWGNLSPDFEAKYYFELIFQKPTLTKKFLTIEDRYTRISKLSKKAKKLAEEAEKATDQRGKIDLKKKAQEAIEKAKKYQKQVKYQSDKEMPQITDTKRKQAIETARTKAENDFKEAEDKIKLLPEGSGT